jgi:hypothetical protein
LAVKVADWPATKEAVVPEQGPDGKVRDWQSMAERELLSEGEVWRSATETLVSAVCPVLVTRNE